jgi:hypothetical protein
LTSCGAEPCLGRLAQPSRRDFVHGNPRKCSNRTNAEFILDVLPVELNGSGRDAQKIRRLFCRISPGQKLQNLYLSDRQHGRKSAADDGLSQVRAKLRGNRVPRLAPPPPLHDGPPPVLDTRRLLAVRSRCRTGRDPGAPQPADSAFPCPIRVLPKSQFPARQELPPNRLDELACYLFLGDTMCDVGRVRDIIHCRHCGADNRVTPGMIGKVCSLCGRAIYKLKTNTRRQVFSLPPCG